MPIDYSVEAARYDTTRGGEERAEAAPPGHVARRRRRNRHRQQPPGGARSPGGGHRPDHRDAPPCAGAPAWSRGLHGRAESAASRSIRLFSVKSWSEANRPISRREIGRLVKGRIDLVLRCTDLDTALGDEPGAPAWLGPRRRHHPLRCDRGCSHGRRRPHARSPAARPGEGTSLAEP